MANMIHFGGSGSSKDFIFKDGVFKIQPTINTGVIQPNKALRLTNPQQLIIPYVSDKEIVYVKYKRVSSLGYFGLLTNSTRNGVTITPEPDVYVGTYDSANEFVVAGIKTKTVINCTASYASGGVSATVDILEIWTEK